MLKVFYFDIDGTLLDYEDAPKEGLINGKLEAALKEANFDFLACVSGWVDIFSTDVMQLNLEQRKEAIYQKLSDLFPDEDWFMERLMLIRDSDNRCTHIDLEIEWFYVDDWAEEFFKKAHGEELYESEMDNRILMCDHALDGSDIIEWIKRVC